MSEHGFDRKVEHLCRRYYRGPKGRPSMAPGVYFRMLMIRYFEGLDSERGIAWRVAYSLSLRSFLGYGLDESAPDFSTVSRTRRVYDLATHKAVFAWVLRRVSEAGLLGKTVAVDGTPLEANAAMRSIVRRDTGQGYQEFLKGLAEAAGIENPTREQLAGFERKRKKKTSNDDWKHPHDPDARVTKMKDGRTRLAHKVENAVDLSSGALRAITIQPGDTGDTTGLFETLSAADLLAERTASAVIEELVTDKGYHSDDVLIRLHDFGVRNYVAEPDCGRRHWNERRAQQTRVYANRRRTRSGRGRRLHRKRAELAERSNAHMYETGGMRHLYLRGGTNIEKRLVIQGAGFNLGLIMRKRFGIGKPRALQGLLSRVFGLGFGITARGSGILQFIRALRAPQLAPSAAAALVTPRLRASY